MCNLSQVVKEKGMAEGRAEGELIVIARMLDNGYTEADIIKLGYTNDDIKKAKEMITVNA